MAARRSEFALIRDFFGPLAARSPQSLGLTDDAALIGVDQGDDLAVSVDALVAGVHFFPDDPPEDIAAKALRVNLSDMAAMGAWPLGVFLAIALPSDHDDLWVQAFARGLEADLQAFGLGLFGGDTVSTSGPLVISVTISGTVPQGRALKRSGARVGDDLWVSGTLGDGALGLRVAKGALTDCLSPADRAFLLSRYRRPDPRIALGLALRGVASGAMDISDGLWADGIHMAKASCVLLEIESPSLPLSVPAGMLGRMGWDVLDDALCGGDDYELLFSAPPDLRDAVYAAAESAGVLVTRIGHVRAGDPGVRVLDAHGLDRKPGHRTGWTHESSLATGQGEMDRRKGDT